MDGAPSDARLARGLACYRSGKASLGRAAEIAGMPIGAFLDAMHQAGIPLRYRAEDLADDMSWANGMTP
jgi:predicted HTH domain antitoxin